MANNCNLLLLLPIQLPIDNIQLATLSLDLAKSEQLVQNGHRLKNLSQRLWSTLHRDNEPPHLSTLYTLFNALLTSNDSVNPLPSSHQQESTPRPSSPNNQPSQLQPPPQIFSTAPTPPIASSPINPPSSLTILPGLPDQNPSHPCLLLSPQPNQLADQSSSDCSSNHPSSTGFDSADPNIAKHSRPLMDLRYSSDSTTPSSIGLKSFATSLSVEGRDEQPHQDTTKPNHHPKPSTSGIHHPHRRATSTAGLKHKSRPISFVRLHSHTSSRSVSPRLVQPIRENQHSPWSEEAHHPPQAPVRSSLSHQPPPPPPSSSRPISKSTAVLPSNHHASLDSLGSDPRTGPNDDSYDSSASLPSLVSPVIPVTPNNSRVSAPFPASEAIIPHSLASSHTTGISSFLPSAPPPTPAENGAHLPTTMSAALIKSKPPQRISVPAPLPAAATPAAAGGKKKAKFFIKESEVDDERSPPLEPIQPSDVRTGRASTDVNVRTPQLTPVASTTRSTALLPKTNNQAQQGSGRDREELEGTDSDEWGSEYSDDEGDDESIQVSKYQEIEKKNEEEYYRQLFAKKHFDQRNRSHDGTEQPPPIRRAGLSMLFHPELNHLQHHPRSDQPVSSTVAPVRNQSALELRRQGSSSSRRPGENGSSHAHTPHGPRLSLGLLPRPCSLIKSKSSVAVPVLAGHEPPAMVQRSPSSHDAQSSVTRQFQRPTPSGSNSIPNSTGPVVAPQQQQQQPPTRSLPPPQQQPHHHQRHPSRLGGKPENVEYSDDDSDSDQGGSNSKKKETVQMTEEQERRLGRLVNKKSSNQQHPTTLSPTRETSKTEPIVLTTQPSRPQPIAAPLSPRTTRKNMFANELTESLRRNLIRERQMRAQAFGVLINDNHNNLGGHGNNNNNMVVDDNEMMKGKIDHRPTRTLARNSKTTSSRKNHTTDSSDDHNSANVVNREYRNFSKGFHRTGW